MIGGGQKGAALVRWQGEVKPMVCHQIDYLRRCGVNEIYVVVGYKARSVIERLKEYGYRDEVGIVWDFEIRGLGETWRQAMTQICGCKCDGFVSLNVDDFQAPGTEEIVKENIGGDVGVIFGVDEKLPNKSSYVINWKTMEVLMCFEDGLLGTVSGCGLYYVVGDVCKTDRDDPGDVINQLIGGQNRRFKFVFLKRWYDMGNPEVLEGWLVKI